MSSLLPGFAVMERSASVRSRSEDDTAAQTSTPKKRKGQSEEIEDLTSFKLSDYTETKLHLSYKQIKLDEKLEKGQVCPPPDPVAVLL